MVMCYGVVIGWGDFYELGIYIIKCKVEWLYWILIRNMIECEFEVYVQYENGIEFGFWNVFGLWVFYFYFGECDIYLCIYGMLFLILIGSCVSFGCVCMVMVYINGFYLCVQIGVIVYFYLLEGSVMVIS